MTTTTTLRSLADEYTGPPKSSFLEQSWHERDVEAIFRPRWLVAGHVDELRADSGGHAYLTFSLGDEEVLIRRDDAGSIKAYHNVCPHRGAQLCPSGTGTAASKRIVCPYHAWTFSAMDGSLMSARHMHDDFDKDALGLMPVHVEVWNGLIFVCLADDAPPPISDYMGATSFGGYDISSMKLAAKKSHFIEANWKIVVENNLECYHCVVIHPELSAVMDWKHIAERDFDGHLAERAAGLEVAEPAPIPSALTIDNQRVCGIPLPRRDVEVDPATYLLVWEPGAALHLSRDAGWIFVPIAVGPSRTELHQYWFVADDAEEGRDFDIDALQRFWDTTMLQDRQACEAVQAGMRMPAYRPGPLNRVYQAGQAGFYAWYAEQINSRWPELEIS